MDGYRTRLTGLTADEAEALFLAGVPGPAGDLGLGTALVAAQLKLLAVLPPELRERAGRVGERFHTDVPRWFEHDDPGERRHLAAIAGAVWDDGLLELGYRREGRATAARVVEPLGLVLKAGTWYLVARPAAGGEPRVYRLSRVMAAARREGSVARPADFDLPAFWRRWSRAFEAGLPRVEVTVRLAPWTVEAARAAAIEVVLGEPEAGGWVRATLTFERLEWAQNALLGLGPDVEVLEPVELRARAAASALAIAARYPP